MFDTNRRIKLKLSKEELPYEHILAKGMEKMVTQASSADSSIRVLR